MEKNLKGSDASGVDISKGTREYTEEDFGPKLEEESYGWLVFKTVIILGSIVGGFYFFLRFVTKKTGVRVLGEDVVQVLSIVPLGQNKFLQVVDLAGKILVLGIADNSITLICEITEKDEIDSIRLLSSRSSQVKGGGFQEYIAKQIGRIFRGDERKIKREKYRGDFDTEESGVDLNYLKDQKDRLKNMNGLKDE